MAMRRPKKPEETRREVPSYMMSFGDMMTLLLTFFIMLCTMAREQSAGLVSAGTGSFVAAINAFGLPGMMPSGKNPLTFQAERPKFPIPGKGSDAPKGFRGYRKPIPLRPDGVPQSVVEYLKNGYRVTIPCDVRFQGQGTALTASDREFLEELCELMHNAAFRIQIEGHVSAKFPPTPQYPTSWHLAAARAAAVAEYMHRVGGVPYHRLSVIGYGEHRPLIRGESPKRQETNERIVLVVERAVATN